MTEDQTPNVGYMNPPQHTRFKKGKSGNPRGRPRRRDDLNTVLNRVLNRKVRVKDDDQKLPIRDALIWKLRELALQGDTQALVLQRRIVAEADAQSPAETAEEKRDRILKRVRRKCAKPDTEESER